MSSSTRTIRIEVLNPNNRHWTYARGCLSCYASAESAMQRALNQFSFTTKARAVDQESGSIVSFMEN